MSDPIHVLTVHGTRPEAIKMAPVIEALRRRAGALSVTVCATAQHRDMLDQVQQVFGLEPDVDLDLMRPDQTLNDILARAVRAIDEVLTRVQPDWILVQGDTTTAMAAGLAAFHRGIRLGHVEAGLRTGDLERPFPEEANRRIVDLVADALFAPTDHARRRLLAEGVAEDKVFVTGNTVVDALQQIAASFPEGPSTVDEVLVTVHRRESFGEVLREIFRALRELAEAFPGLTWVYPVHRNPNVRRPAGEELGDLGNFRLIEPLDYLDLVRHLMRARLVVTDSGGLQEEAPTFGKPVLVLRDTTERPEGVDAGVTRLVGTERQRIVEEVTAVLSQPETYARMVASENPYGDGAAAERIAAILAGEAWSPPGSGR